MLKNIKANIADVRRQCWRTPLELFEKLNTLFNFTIDACASSENALCERYWTKEQDCTAQDWSKEIVFCNPPFGNIGKIVAKAPTAITTVFLFPMSSITTKYFNLFNPIAIAIPGYRINFVPPEGITCKSPTFGTIIAVYGKVSSTQLNGLKEMNLLVYERLICLS